MTKTVGQCAEIGRAEIWRIAVASVGDSPLEIPASRYNATRQWLLGVGNELNQPTRVVFAPWGRRSPVASTLHTPTVPAAASRLLTEPRRVRNDDASYARYGFDMTLRWVSVP